ncbi:MAG: EAL domain-containing protein [Arcobacteraceae bacterium]|nr:EAL domain-containing protein [Arcobacteraceae bacterium]
MRKEDLLIFKKTLNILYVEDDSGIRDVMNDMLNDIFSSVTLALNGQDGLDKFKNNITKEVKVFDLILSDICMPKLDGISMSQKIREIDQDIPIIFLTAFSDIDYFLKSIKLGIDGYIIKPVEYKSFISTINKVIQRLYLRKQNQEYKNNLESKVKEQTIELRYKNNELEVRYYHDSLTGLQNRYALIRDITKYSNPRMMLIDINRFSTINNIYGGKVGDKVLINVARILDDFKEEECIAYRVSADQFTLVRDVKDDITCDQAAQMVLDKITSEPIKIIVDDTEVDINLTVTIGLVKDIENVKLLEYADMTLKYAKRTYQPFVFYSPELKIEKNYQKALDAVNLVKNALEEDTLVPFFQPIVKEDEISYECLVRILSDGKVISPFFFIDEIKHTTYYTQLTITMINKSFEYFKDKLNSFSINLSFEDILNSHIIEHIKHKLETTKMNNQLILEILESESIENFEIVKSFINEMKSLGVRIALDDFGSGYSNFTYLQELNPDYLKIDGSLIKDIDTNDRSHIIVKTIVSFAQELGIKTIAEFIHNEDVYKKVVELNIDGHQGYFLGEPKESLLVV